MSTTTSNTCTPISISRNPNSPKPFLNPMRVLGIDCGSRVTGYGVIDTDGAECFLVQCGAIRSKSSEPLASRLRNIHNGIVEVIREFQPEAAAFESLFFATNAQSALKLGHV